MKAPTFKTYAEEIAYKRGFVDGDLFAEKRIIKVLEGLMNFETNTQRRIDHKLALQVLKDALIKGEK